MKLNNQLSQKLSHNRFPVLEYPVHGRLQALDRQLHFKEVNFSYSAR
jgi:hypothetical protein